LKRGCEGVKDSVCAWRRLGLATCGVVFGLGVSCEWWGQEAGEISVWQKLVSFQAMGGYKDNVLLSSALPEGSAFIGGGVELIGWRPFGDGGEFLGFVVGDHRQFLDAQEVDYEQTFVAQAELRHPFGESWELVGPVEYFYVDQVMDVSATEVEVEPTRVQGQNFGVRPGVGRDVGSGRVELEVSVVRQLYAAPLDDAWEAGGKVEWQHGLGDRGRLDMAYDFRETWYDNDPALGADGVPLPGSRRQMDRHEAGVDSRWEWGRGREWRLTGGVSGVWTRDRQEGFYDYFRPGAQVNLRYRSGGWTFSVGGRARYFSYAQQTVSTIDSSLRHRVELGWNGKVERELTEWLSVFGEYDFERTTSNRPAESYRVNTVSLGLEAFF
jgi:hypothetical protein